MLQIKNLNIFHKKDCKYIIKNLDFVVNKSDKVCIIGDEGTGKSTLLKWLKNPLSDLEYVKIDATVVNDFKKVAYLPQFIEEKYLDLSISDYLFTDDTDYNNIYSIASKFEFNIDDKKLNELSGGNLVKVQLIKLLSENPDLLLLDEPSNNLDLETLIWFENFLKNTDKTIIFVSHDEDLLKSVAMKIIHLELVKKRNEAKASFESISYEQYLEKRENNYLYDFKIATRQRKEYKEKIDKLYKIKAKVNKAQFKSASMYEKKKMLNILAVEKRFEKEKSNFVAIPEKDKIISFDFEIDENLNKVKNIFYISTEKLELNHGVVLKNLNINILFDSKIGFIGKNGIGKSTFLKYIYDNIKNKSGIKVGFMPQNYEEKLDYNLTIEEYFKNFNETKLKSFLSNMNFTREEMTRKIKDLSGGQKAKLILLELSFEKCNVLILDEPSRNLSPLSGPVLRKVFRYFKGCIISVSHDRSFLDEVCDEIIELKNE